MVISRSGMCRTSVLRKKDLLGMEHGVWRFVSPTTELGMGQG